MLIGYILFMPKNGKLPEKATFFLMFVSILLAALAVLILGSGDAFAGVNAVPEPGTLALLAAGFGVFAAVKYFGRR